MKITKALAVLAMAIAGPLTAMFLISGTSAFAGVSTIFGGHPGIKVTLCHRTNSASNPYVSITVNVSSVADAQNLGGHLKHPDDVIPPYTFTDDTGTFSFPGQGDQSQLENDCNGPNPTTSSTTSTTTSTTGTTSTTTSSSTSTTSTTTTTTPSSTTSTTTEPTTSTTPTTSTSTQTIPTTSSSTTSTTSSSTTTTTPLTTTTTPATTPTTTGQKPSSPPSKPKPVAKPPVKGGGVPSKCPAGTKRKNGVCVRSFHGEPHAVITGNG